MKNKGLMTLGLVAGGLLVAGAGFSAYAYSAFKKKRAACPTVECRNRNPNGSYADMSWDTCEKACSFSALEIWGSRFAGFG